MSRPGGTAAVGKRASAVPGRFDPVLGRPLMPAGYGLKQGSAGLLSWRWVSDRMRRSRNYWIATTRPGGIPHCVPVWGVWIDDVLYFGTDRASRKAQNLLQQARMVAHLESGDDAIIMNGRAVEVTDPELLSKVDRAYLRKYKLRMSEAPGSLVVFAVAPSVFLAWRERDFPKSATRMVAKK